MRKSIWIFCLIISLPLISKTQTSFQLGALPSLNFNAKLPKDWSLNFKAESRQALYNENFDYDYLRTDISLGGGKKIGINTTLSMAYLMRIDNNSISHRAIQQLSFVRRYTGFRLSHRIAADQTFSKHESTEIRLRYRLSSEIPLQGQSLDPKEFFLKLSNEYLNAFERDDYDLEIRLAAFIGYALSATSKLEIGFDNRLDSFILNGTRNRLWIGINFYQAL
jgi:hypothetical protein